MLLLIQCVVCCILFTLIILPPLYKDPLNMIMSYPPAIIRRVEKLPEYKDVIKKREKKHVIKKLLGLIFFVICFAAVAYFSGCRSFSETFVHVFVILFAANIFDLIVLDWGIFCHSQKLRIPGTEDMDKDYQNKLFHARGAVVGSVISLIVALLSGCIVHLALL